MTLNERIAYFQDVIDQTFRDFFAERGYTFREDVAAMSHEETQWYGYQAFSKSLGEQGYVHVAFLPHLAYPEPTFRFWVLCLRHLGHSPPQPPFHHCRSLCTALGSTTPGTFGRKESWHSSVRWSDNG